MKFSSYFSMFVGGLIIGQWSYFILSGSVPEFNTTPIEISMHISVEFLTALLLFISGNRLLKKKEDSGKWSLLAHGMLIYTIINSSGYFAQIGQWPLVLMFAVLLILSLISVKRLIKGVE